MPKMNQFRKWIATALIVAPGVMVSAAPARSYPVDCAILICLAGGWPASTPCAQARAEFVRRITPWPIEPPLQIWRCPMRTALIGPAPLPQSQGTLKTNGQPMSEKSLPWLDEIIQASETAGSEQADIDISGPAFDFVRSIRVFYIDYRQQDSDKTSCVTSDSTRLGSYGAQGDFRWTPSSAEEVPPASGLEASSHCRAYRYRSVFVDWRDHAGHYGFKEVHF